jgi:hypothetical protein
MPTFLLIWLKCFLSSSRYLLETEFLFEKEHAENAYTHRFFVCQCLYLGNAFADEYGFCFYPETDCEVACVDQDGRAIHGDTTPNKAKNHHDWAETLESPQAL